MATTPITPVRKAQEAQAPAPAPKYVPQRSPRDEHTGKAGRYVRDKATGERRPA